MDEAVCNLGILGFRVRVTGPATLVHALPALFPPAPAWAAPPDPEATAHVRIHRDTPHAGWYRVAHDGSTLWETEQGDTVVPYLEWAINGLVVERIGHRYLLFHAGAVAYGECGLILPAAGGSGKTTLVAGLLGSGFRYLSDELAAIELSTLRLMPYAKSLCVKPGAHAVLQSHYPQLATVAPLRRPTGEQVWYLPPPEETWPPGPVPVRYVVLPRYVAGGETVLTSVSRSTALQCLLEQSFTARAHGARGVAAITAMLRRVECFDLQVGNLERAVSLLQRLVRS